ncbi:hypothetical protein ABBQ38_007665 [Trebouxia sp. C0009 RCD-2024]
MRAQAPAEERRCASSWNLRHTQAAFNLVALLGFTLIAGLEAVCILNSDTALALSDSEHGGTIIIA